TIRSGPSDYCPNFDSLLCFASSPLTHQPESCDQSSTAPATASPSPRFWFFLQTSDSAVGPGFRVRPKASTQLRLHVDTFRVDTFEDNKVLCAENVQILRQLASLIYEIDF
ncbi:hypothetical protein WG66_004712, partial [Moniliophthora roreri]